MKIDLVATIDALRKATPAELLEFWGLVGLLVATFFIGLWGAMSDQERYRAVWWVVDRVLWVRRFPWFMDWAGDIAVQSFKTALCKDAPLLSTEHDYRELENPRLSQCKECGKLVATVDLKRDDVRPIP